MVRDEIRENAPYLIAPWMIPVGVMPAASGG